MSAHRSPRGDEVTELARLLPVPAERDLPDGQMLLLREHLMAELHASRGPAVTERSDAAGHGWRGEPGGTGWTSGPVPRAGPGWRFDRHFKSGPGRVSEYGQMQASNP